MFPSPAGHNITNRLTGHTNLLRHAGRRELIGIGSNPAYVSFSQPCMRRENTDNRSLPALCDHVVIVVEGGSQKKVFGVDTCPVVAPMTDEQTVRDGVMGKFPCHTMGKSGSALSFSVDRGEPIAPSADLTLPIPARVPVCDIDARPETRRIRRCQFLAASVGFGIGLGA